jgi:hypothetical protein
MSGEHLRVLVANEREHCIGLVTTLVTARPASAASAR